MKDDENPEDGECDVCDSRCGNEGLSLVEACEFCLDAPKSRDENHRLRALLRRAAGTLTLVSTGPNMPDTASNCQERLREIERELGEERT